MAKITSIYMDYESVMIRKKTTKNYKVILKGEDEEQGLEHATKLLKYVFENILEWSPRMIHDYFTPEIKDWLNLDVCTRKIPFPPELNPHKDLFYIAHYLYPDVISYNKKSAVLDTYNKSIENNNNKLPKDFFRNNDGKDNFDICLKYVISEKFFLSDSKEIYDFFAKHRQAVNYLREKELYLPCERYYESMLEAVHHILPAAEKNDTIYYKYRLNEILSKAKIKCTVRELKSEKEVKYKILKNSTTFRQFKKFQKKFKHKDIVIYDYDEYWEGKK